MVRVTLRGLSWVVGVARTCAMHGKGQLDLWYKNRNLVVDDTKGAGGKYGRGGG